MAQIPCLIPYERDELTYSWLHRLFLYNYAPYKNMFNQLFINPVKYADVRHQKAIEYDFTENLAYFRKASGLNDLEFQKMFFQTSLFPAFAPFMNPLQKNLYLALAIGPLSKEDKEILQDTISQITTELKFCPECMKQEKNVQGYFWFHRAHQLPGVVVCHEHKVPLIKYSGMKQHEFDEPLKGTALVDKASKIDIEYAVFAKEFMDSAFGVEYSSIRDIMRKKCKQKHFDIHDYTDLNDAVKASDMLHLFKIKPCFYMQRSDVEGTYFDPNNGLPLLFFLFGTVNEVKAALKNAVGELPLISVSLSMNEIHNQIKGYKQTKKKVNSKYDLGHYNVRTKEIFMEEITALVGDEYTLVGDFIDTKTKVKLRHNKCGRAVELKPSTFLDGGRCKHCQKFIFNKSMNDIVSELSHGRYSIIGRATVNLMILHDNVTCKDITLDKYKIIQELTRKTPSEILQQDERRKEQNIKATTDIEKVLLWLREEYSQKELIFLKDISIEWMPYKRLKSIMNNLVKGDKLKRYALGMYAFPNTDFTADDLLTGMYLSRRGEHIGFYYGNSFASELGLGSESKTKYIVTNEESMVHGRKKNVFGIDIRIKGSIVPVQNENFKILPVLDFLLSYWKYTNAGYDKVKIVAVRYLLRNKITKMLLEKYASFYNWSQNLILEDIYKELE